MDSRATLVCIRYKWQQSNNNKNWKIHTILNFYRPPWFSRTFNLDLFYPCFREGRVDLFVQSCDKNLLVPVSGAIVAGFSKEVMGRVAQIYPGKNIYTKGNLWLCLIWYKLICLLSGRASISPTLDVFITLLSLGSYNYLQLVKQRKELFVYMRHELSNLADKHGERVVENVNNTISSGNW